MKKTIVWFLCLLLAMSGFFVLSGCNGSPGNGSNGKKITGELAFPELTGLTGDKFTVFGTSVSIGGEDKALLKTEYNLEPEYVNVPWEEQRTRLATLIMSGSSPDIALIGRSGYDFITKDLAQSIDPYIDFSHPFYKDILDAYETTEWSGGKHYSLIRNKVKLGGMLYNTKMFDDAGQPDPWTLYKDNEWTWDTFREMSRELAGDTNSDGENDVFAFGFFRPQMFIHTTGKAWGSLNAQTMTVTNNVKDSDVARAMNLIYDMMYVDKTGTSSTECLKEFGEERLAMMLYDNTPIAQPEVIKVIKKGHAGIVPLPRDPKADGYYTYSYIADDIIPKGAKNPQAAVALNAVFRYRGMEKASAEKDEKLMRDEYGFTDLLLEQHNEIHKIGQGVIPIFERMEMLGYNASWDCVYTGIPWATAIKERESEVNAWLSDLLEEQEVEAPTGPKNIELFESYPYTAGEPLSTPKLYPVSDGSSNYTIYLDTAAKEGKYAAKIQYDFSKEDVTYGGFKKNLNSTWNTNNTMTLWAKGDGKPQNITISFTAGDVPWQYVLAVDGSEGQVYEIPFSDFTLPDWYEEEETLDVTLLTSIYFTFDGQGANRVICLDDIRVFRK